MIELIYSPDIQCLSVLTLLRCGPSQHGVLPFLFTQCQIALPGVTEILFNYSRHSSNNLRRNQPIQIKPLWHLRDREILFDGNILTNYNFSSKIRGRMDVCYVSYLYFRAEIANYIENLYFVGGKLCKNIANNQKY